MYEARLVFNKIHLESDGVVRFVRQLSFILSWEIPAIVRPSETVRFSFSVSFPSKRVGEIAGHNILISTKAHNRT